MRNPILIDIPVCKSEIVRLNKEATEIIQSFQKENGGDASKIASQIIVKAVRECGIEPNYIPRNGAWGNV